MEKSDVCGLLLLEGETSTGKRYKLFGQWYRDFKKTRHIQTVKLIFVFRLIQTTTTVAIQSVRKLFLDDYSTLIDTIVRAHEIVEKPVRKL